MAVPKKRQTKSRRNMRRSHHALDVPAMAVDKKTKSVHRPHHIDLKTGLYRGKQYLFADEAEATPPAGEAPKA